MAEGIIPEVTFSATSLAPEVQDVIPSGLVRETPYLTHSIFNTHDTFVQNLSKDLSLCHSMIPLGSCTMKLNATTEMMPVTWQPLQICILLLLPNKHRGIRSVQEFGGHSVYHNRI
ncbi:hypothetical protein Lser_V15G44521 [Lactuca serriola]